MMLIFGLRQLLAVALTVQSVDPTQPREAWRLISPSGLRQQAGHITAASDTWATRILTSCQRGAIHT